MAHCPIVRENPNGCTGCLNNPHESAVLQAKQEDTHKYTPLLSRAFRLHNLAEFGMLTRDQLSTIEFEMLETIHEQILEKRMKLQAALIAEAVGKMFGSK